MAEVDYDALANQIRKGSAPPSVASVMEPSKSAAQSTFESADYVKTNNGYVLNKANPNAKATGTVKVLDNGKMREVPIDPNRPAALVPGLIEGHLRNLPENQKSVLDRIKATPLSAIPGMSDVSVGNLAEGLGSTTTLRNAVRTGGAMIGGTAGLAAGAPTGPGAIATAGAGGALGAAGGDALLNTAQAVANRYDTNPVMGAISNAIGKPPEDAEAQILSNAGAATQGALQEGGGKALSLGATKVFQNLAERQVAKILTPTGNAMKADVAEAASALASDMPIGLTDKHLLGRINSKVNTLGQGVDDAYAALRGSNIQVPSAPVVKALNDAKDAFMVRGQPIPGLENIVANYDQLIDGIGNNPTLNTDEFRKVKQGWDAAINWSRNAQARTPAMEKALTDGANAIREALHTISPTLEKADSQFSLWKTAQDSLKNKVTSAVGSRNALVSNSTILSGVIGSGVGAAVGGATGAAGGAAAAETLNLLMGTTAYRSSSLAVKAGVQAALKEGLTQKAIGLILAQGSMSAEEGVRKLMVPDNVPAGKR